MSLNDVDQIEILTQRINDAYELKAKKTELRSQIDATSDADTLRSLQEELERVDTDYQSQNITLITTYGINLDSPLEYLFLAQRANVLVQMEDAGEFALTGELKTSEEIKQFQRDRSLIAQLGQRAEQIQQTLPRVDDEAEKAKLKASFEQIRALFEVSNAKLFDSYGYTFKRPSKTQNSVLDIYSQAPLPKLNNTPSVPNDYVLIGALESIEANLEFERNVNAMENAREEAKRLTRAILTEKDTAKEAELREALAKLNETINANSIKMIDAYKYSLDRNYKQIVTKARLYIKLTEDEINQQKEKDPNYLVPENGFVELLSINDVDANLAFQNDAQLMEYLRAQLVQLRQALESEKDEAVIQQLQAQLDQASKDLTKINTTMTEVYKYSIKRSYEYVVEASDLYLQLTREEIAALDLQAAKTTE